MTYLVARTEGGCWVLSEEDFDKLVLHFAGEGCRPVQVDLNGVKCWAFQPIQS